MNGGRSAVGSPGRGPVGQVQSCVRRGPHAAIREERARAEASRRCRPGVAEAESEDACDREGGGRGWARTRTTVLAPKSTNPTYRRSPGCYTGGRWHRGARWSKAQSRRLENREGTAAAIPPRSPPDLRLLSVKASMIALGSAFHRNQWQRIQISLKDTV